MFLEPAASEVPVFTRFSNGKRKLPDGLSRTALHVPCCQWCQGTLLCLGQQGRLSPGPAFSRAGVGLTLQGLLFTDVIAQTSEWT